MTCSRGIALLLLIIIGGCSTIDQSGFGGTDARLPPVPPLYRFDCCWQSEELVTISTGEGEKTFLSVVSRQAERLVLVVLDNLGRRLFTLVYRNAEDGGELIDVDTPPGWRDSFSRYLLIAVLLDNAQPGSWIADDPNWQVETSAAQKRLTNKGKSSVILDYQSEKKHDRKISFPGPPVSIRVVRLSRTVL